MSLKKVIMSLQLVVVISLLPKVRRLIDTAASVKNAPTIKFDVVQSARCDQRLVCRANRFG